MEKEHCYLKEFGYEKFEKAGLVNRKEYQQVPPKVEYSLTQMGRDLEPVVKEIHT